MSDQSERVRCERCGHPYDFDHDDYCAACGRNLCPVCMTAGCCGAAPAASGLAADHTDPDAKSAPRIDGIVPGADQPD